MQLSHRWGWLLSVLMLGACSGSVSTLPPVSESATNTVQAITVEDGSVVSNAESQQDLFEDVGQIQSLPPGYRFGRNTGLWRINNVFVQVTAATQLPADRLAIGDTIGFRGRQITPRYVIATEIGPFLPCPVPSPFPATIALPPSLIVGQSVNPQLNLTTQISNPIEFSYNWTVTPSSGVNPSTSTSISPTITFAQPGSFIVSVSGAYTINTIPGCTATVAYSASAPISVFIP